MKNKKVLTVAMLAGLTLGGLSVATVTSAQGYGGDAETTQDTTGNEASETNSADQGSIVQVQVQDEADNGETPEAGERDGRRGRRGCNLDEAAAAIGIDEADLRAALDDGDSIADVAEANGVDADTVIDALVDAKADRIAEKVAEGRITQEEADQKLADVEARITDRVNGVEDTPEA